MPRELIRLECQNQNGRARTLYLPLWPKEQLLPGQRIQTLRIVRVRRVALPAWQRWRLYPRGNNKIRFRIDFLWRLNLLLSSGISLTDALSQLTQVNCSALVNSCLYGLLMDLHQGKSFAQALSRMSWLFPPRILGLMRHAEKTGQLAEVLEMLIANDEWMFGCTQKMLRALLYPTILLAIMFAIAMVMLFFVMPNFAQLLIDSGKMNPAEPAWWWALSVWASQTWVWGSAVALSVPVAFICWRQRHRIIRLLPATNKLHHSKQMHLFEFMYEAGIHLPDILTALGDSERSRDDRRKYLKIAELLRQGCSLSEAFAQVPMLPPLVLTLLKAGESCGRLGFAALQAGNSLEREANELMKSFEQWLTPICLLLMGGLMAWMFTGLTGALYDFDSPL